MDVAAIVLAAGKGTRMTADLPKVLHDIDGRPMLLYVLDAIGPIATSGTYVVVGYKADEVRRACADRAVNFVTQAEQLGTGHAVMQCEAALGSFTGTIVVLNGDVPCLRPETISKFVAFHNDRAAAATVLTAILDDPAGYGRIVTDEAGALQAIVEHKDADEATRRIAEINSGLFCFDGRLLFESLGGLDTDNAQQEYYLTDVIASLKEKGKGVYSFCVGDPREVSGVNTDAELDAIRAYMRDRT